MESVQNVVFFDADNLSDTDLKHIERHFQIKRRSGGGECKILKVGANTYNICFKEKAGKQII